MSQASSLVLGLVRGCSPDPSGLSVEEASSISLSDCQPWLKAPQTRLQPPLEEQVVDQFMDKYVMYPCNQTSSPGFLEHLPCMFKEVNVEGRHALRWAVQAAAYANIAKDQTGDALAVKALQCYGMALKALGDSLSTAGKQPDDYDLMTVVILDIFETLHTPAEVRKGTHVQGMAQILRLRGSDLVYSSRGWMLFRLANHRIQKQQLAYNMAEIAEKTAWFSQLNDGEPYVRLEKSTHDIGETCKRAQALLGLIDTGGMSAPAIIDTVRELRSLDQETATWRQTSEWCFTSIKLSDRPDLIPATRGVTNTIQVHSDVWMAYEWNYHRTARIIFLQQLLECSEAALQMPELEDSDGQMLRNTISDCTSTIRKLADEVFATVPQTFGDINHMGHGQSENSSPGRCRAIGGYLLLWPVRIIKGERFATTRAQKKQASSVFERIRDYTGMKDLLGDKSIV
ncbi:hypothetical protein B0H67DRAFT_650318 [Lasiosphaeris hirsuta]|uniref:Negative acting factor n=1 Tax=Lasiosphaeris hirsuta TaxID=260670 RepID=A0AA39ZRJ0_9PEZI|nr:hypothetical protein B0H67DRAFT_650318 [Lasiosphaeris hirsuta]